MRGANLKVTYDVKELLAEIRDELKALNLQIAAKADRDDVNKIEARVEAIEKDPVWVARTNTSVEFQQVKANVAALKMRIAVFGAVASILAMTAGAVARYVFP